MVFILCIALFPYHGDSSGAILEVPSEALLHLSVVSRSSLGKMRQGIRDVKEAAILRKVLFWWLGVLRFILGSSLVSPWSLIRERLARYKGRES